MALLAYQSIGITGLAPTLAAAGTDTVAPNDRGFLLVKNSHATNAATVTIVVPGSQYGQARPDVAVNVPALTERMLIGPLVADLATGDLINVNTTGTGTPTIAAVTI